MHTVLATEGASPNRLVGIVAPVQMRSRYGKDPKLSALLEGFRQSDRSYKSPTLQLLHGQPPRGRGGSERAPNHVLH